MTTLWIALAGGLGALCRFGVDKLISSWINRIRRQRQGSTDTARNRYWQGWGISLVNLSGCFLVGVLAGVGSPWFAPPLEIGFLGAYTTYSTVIMDTIGYSLKPQFEMKSALLAALILGANIVLGILAALGGLWITRL